MKTENGIGEMVVWTLESDTDFTVFNFLSEEDKTYFHELVEECFENSIPVLERWRPLYMLRAAPMKHPDFFEIDGTDVIAISQIAFDCIHNYFNNEIEFLPIKTDTGRYYALNVLKFVDCLNKEESDYVITKNGIIVNYSSLEFDEKKLGKNGIFKIPELPYCTFISDEFQDLCEENDLQGLVFDPESNLVWYPD